jgi:micrococcal nuclease
MARRIGDATMPFPKYKYSIRIGAWTLTQWFKFTVVLLGVLGAATYITNNGRRQLLVDNLTKSHATLPAKDGEFTAEVIEVVDGDTLDVSGPQGHQRVRLNGIDCPEINQPFGHTAKLLASDMTLHRQVTIRVTGHDQYGRVLADVLFADGRILNQELVKAGMAWWFQKYSNDNQLAALEHEARVKRVGLWSDSEPISPWDFRSRPAK